MSQLQNFFSRHETTDDTTSIDYDYSAEDEDASEPTHITLPVPILNESDSSLYTINEPPQSSTALFDIELNEYSFRDQNETDSSSAESAVPSTVIIDLLKQDGIANSTSTGLPALEESDTSSFTELKVGDENSTDLPQNVDEKNINTETTVESQEQTDATEAPEFTTLDSRDTLNFDDDNYPTTTSAANKSEGVAEADELISSSTAIHLDDYFDTILLNDSLLIDGGRPFENTTDFDYDVTTIVDSSIGQHSADEEVYEGSAASEKTVIDQMITSTSTTTDRGGFSPSFPYESRIIDDDASNKFIHHHLPAADRDVPTVLEPPSRVRFPSQGEPDRGQRVRFPDESSSTKSFSWPRDNGYLMMRFWLDQPLINDFKYFSRGNSRAPSGSFNRQMSYRRN